MNLVNLFYEEDSMNVQSIAANTTDPDATRLYRLGGLSAIALGIGYIVIMLLYIPMGAPPSGEERLTYLAANTWTWWAILGLSVLTDFLFVPLGLALYVALKGLNRNLMLLGTALIGLFVVLDLAITWPNYAALITLGNYYIATANETQQAIVVTVATYPATVLDSSLIGFFIILVPGLGILLTGLVMLKGIFNKATAYIGIATGILGVISVVGPFFISALGLTAILTSILTTLWVLMTGYQLYQLGR